MDPSRAQWFVEQRWLPDLFGDARVPNDVRQELLRHVDDVCRGRVKFWRAEKGWGGVESDCTPFDVWVHFSQIEGTGYRQLREGQLVDFRWRPALQDSWHCV